MNIEEAKEKVKFFLDEKSGLNDKDKFFVCRIAMNEYLDDISYTDETETDDDMFSIPGQEDAVSEDDDEDKPELKAPKPKAKKGPNK